MTDNNSVQILSDGRMDSSNAALYIGRKKQTLAQWRSEGGGPKYVKCGRVYYYTADIDEWLHDKKIG